MPGKPTVLIIDDVEESGRATKNLLGADVKSIVRMPGEVSDSDIKSAKLVLIDFRLNHWDDLRIQKTPSLRPQNGVALASVLRSNVELLRASPIAFALNSGVLNELSGSLSASHREHTIARSIDMEWVFAKGSERSAFVSAVCALASAVSSLPDKWPRIQRSRPKLLELLKLSKSSKPWYHQALAEVERSAPPHDTYAETTKGIGVLRWLLHDIIPYPTFLLDLRYLAARLHIEPNSLHDLYRSPTGKRIRNALAPFMYDGILTDFQGPRWWKAGIEHWIWSETKGNPFDKASLHDMVRRVVSRKLELSQLAKPVVSLDDELRPTNNLIELSDSVQVIPDGWPQFAESAWVSKYAAGKDEDLASSVVEADRGRVKKHQTS